MPITTAHVGDTTHALLESGHAVLPRNASRFEIKLADLSFRFSFASDKSLPPSQVATSILDNKSLSFVLTNFEDNLPVTFESEVGNFGGKPLLLSTSLSATGAPDNLTRTIVYSFYQRG